MVKVPGLGGYLKTAKGYLGKANGYIGKATAWAASKATPEMASAASVLKTRMAEQSIARGYSPYISQGAAATNFRNAFRAQFTRNLGWGAGIGAAYGGIQGHRRHTGVMRGAIGGAVKGAGVVSIANAARIATLARGTGMKTALVGAAKSKLNLSAIKGMMEYGDDGLSQAVAAATVVT